MKRIVHKEQSQRGIHVVEGFCAQVMEPASEPRTIEVRRRSCVNGRRESIGKYSGANQGGTAEAFRSLARD